MVRQPASRWFGLLWLAAAGIGLWLALQPAHPLADVSHYKYWARLVALGGVQASYSGSYPESYTIYPPVTMYGLAVVGQAYRALVDPSFEIGRALASHGLTVWIRLMALGMHLVLGAVLYGLLARWAGAWRGLTGAGVYLLSPGALWDVAVWAQPDAWHSLFALLGLWSAALGRGSWAGGWLGLAALTKPQAWALLPLAGLAVWRQGGQGAVLRAGLTGLLVGFAVLSPFLLTGRWREFLSLPSQISSVMPVASANAHNLWWLLTRAAEPFVLDSERVGGLLPLSYRQASVVLVVALLVYVMWLAWRARGPWQLATLAAYTAHGWFSLTTQAHENHPFMIFPFLALVWWRSRLLALLLVLLAAGFSYNVLGHDYGLASWFDATLGPWHTRLQLAASALNLALFAAWTVWLARPTWRADQEKMGPPDLTV